MGQTRRTISRSVSQQNQPKIRVNHDIILPFPAEPDPTPVGKAHLAMPSEALEHSDYMFRSFVCLIYNYHPAQ